MISASIKKILDRLSEKDRRTVKFGAIVVVVILAYGLVLAPFFGHWSDVRAKLAVEKTKLRLIGVSGGAGIAAKQAALLATVPAFQISQSEAKQRLLFEAKLNEQLKKAGINIKSLAFLSRGKLQPKVGLKLLQLQCRGKCNFAQLTDLLAGLNENPYLVGIEEMRITCDQKKREDLELILTVSTFCK